MQVKAWKSYPKDHAPSKVRPMSIVALPRVPMDAEIGKQSWAVEGESRQFLF